MMDKNDPPLFADERGRSKLAEVMGAQIRRTLADNAHTTTAGDLIRCLAYGCARNPLGVCVRCGSYIA